MTLITPNALSRVVSSLRPFTIGFLILIFLIPLGMISGVIRDRIANHHVAVEGIASSWARNQNLFGPVMVLPYTAIVSVDHFNPETQKTSVTRNKVDNTGLFIPDDLMVDVKWMTEERQRGIHRVPVYTATIRLTGRFSDLTKRALNDYREKGFDLGKPYLSVALSDIRGIGATPKALLNNTDSRIEPGSRITSLGGGFHVPFPIDMVSKDDLTFDIQFDLKGINSFHVVPAGGVVEMQGQANWPHPSFNGLFLPDSKQINADGFEANWKTGLLATNILEQITPCVQGTPNTCDSLWQNSFGVAFFQPVDIYTQSLRAAKYGILFVTLTFAIFYVSEILHGTRVYTMQLLLVGSALAIFYLLLISLSEILGFAGAYLIASAAIVALLGYYSSFILKKRKSGIVVGGIVALLYMVLYFNLSSEDYALLIGSGLLFVALAVIMILTRNVDWNAVRKPDQETIA